MAILCLFEPRFHLYTVSLLFKCFFFLYFSQEFLRPLGESEFLPGRVLQKLLDIGFCGGKWSEKACYDIGEFVFGFDDINSNMVGMELFPV